MALMHGLLSGQESRQQLYTMLTRGLAANHVYQRVVDDGDPHTVIGPETVARRTPTEILQQILTCDDRPTSAKVSRCARRVRQDGWLTTRTRGAARSA